MFNSVISSTGLTITSAMICIISSIVLGLIIAVSYIKTSKYRKNFIITLSVLPLLVGTIMIMVNGNLGTSIAIVGAFSLVRFRSLPGTSKEILYVFFAMTIGLAIGMGQIVFATLITITIVLLLLILNRISIINNQSKTLTIVIPENLDYEEVFNTIFTKYLAKVDLLKVKTTNLGSMYELQYEINYKNNIKEQDFINELRERNGNLKIAIHKAEEGELL